MRLALAATLLLASCATERYPMPPAIPLTREELIMYCSQGADEACWKAGIATRPVEIKRRY